MRSVSCDAHDVGGVARVTGVENATEFVVVLKEGICLINEKSRLSFFDDAEKGWRADIRRRHRPIHEFAEDGEERGLAATFFGRFDADVGADVTKLEGIRVNDPKGESLRSVRRKDDVAFEKRGKIVEEKGGREGMLECWNVGILQKHFGGQVCGCIHILVFWV